MKQAAALTAAVLGAALYLHADMASVPMGFYGEFGQTSVYRADVSVTGIGSIRGVQITDNLSLRGSTGVFSGLDVDCAFFDRDGDLTTEGDRILPRTGPETNLTCGAIDKQYTSAYQPTELHPGPLFGLNADCTIDHDTATLGEMDASFHEGLPNLAVDTCDGWLTLGDGGSLHVAFPLFTLDETQSMYLFIGDAGPPQEALAADVEVDFFSEFELYFLGLMGNSIYLGEGDSINLDTSYLNESPCNTLYFWDFDGDGEFDDAVGANPTFSFDYMHETLGMPLGDHTVTVMIVHDCGVGEPEWVEYHETGVHLIPEPGCAVLLLAGAAALLRRRRA